MFRTLIPIKTKLLILGIFVSCTSHAQKIEVLNFATFHMTHTSDAHRVNFDEKDAYRKKETLHIAQLLAEFKPTIICVELPPAKNEALRMDYSNFMKTPAYSPKFAGEIALIAYEVGKLQGVKQIYGIDEQETAAYNYAIAQELNNPVDSITAKKYNLQIQQEFAGLEKLSTLEKLQFFNRKETLQKLINLNADILTYSSTKGNFEGADEASKFYRRNLRIFSNINQIPVTEKDRIFIIMGATHSAFLEEFIQRSPKYKSVSVASYLK